MSKKPLQIYPNEEQREYLDKESERKGLSLNKLILGIIDRSKARKGKAK